MKKIESLTEEQIAKFPQYVKEWTDFGLSTDPANRAEAEKAINQMYILAGKSAPEKIVWCGSPLSQGLTRAIILDKKLLASVGDSVRASVWDSVWDSAGDSVRASVWDSVWDSVGDSVWDSVGDSVWASVGDCVRDCVWDSVWASVGDCVRDCVWDSVWASVGDCVRDCVRDSVGDSVYGQHDASWLAFYKFFNSEVGLIDQTKKLEGLWALCKSAGWAIPHEKVCFVSERHNILCRDGAGRLHNIAGPSVCYPDGWSIYAVHGVRVPEKVIIEKHLTTIEDINSEKNAEVKRVMMELYGFDRYLNDCGAKPVDSQIDKFGNPIELFSLPDAQLPIVRVVNRSPEPDGTFKKYVLTATRKTRSAIDAVASLSGTDAKNWIPVLES